MNVPPSSDTKCDPVQCLKTYIDRTNQFKSDSYSLLFIALRPPYKAISADTDCTILEEAIALANLKGKGFTAKSFRPTGAFTAVSQGTLPKTVKKIGRWKTKEVFMTHYVYGKVPESFTDDIDANVRFTCSVYKLTVLKLTFQDSLCLSLNSAISNKILCEYFLT